MHQKGDAADVQAIFLAIRRFMAFSLRAHRLLSGTLAPLDQCQLAPFVLAESPHGNPMLINHPPADGSRKRAARYLPQSSGSVALR